MNKQCIKTLKRCPCLLCLFIQSRKFGRHLIPYLLILLQHFNVSRSVRYLEISEEMAWVWKHHQVRHGPKVLHTTYLVLKSIWNKLYCLDDSLMTFREQNSVRLTSQATSCMVTPMDIQETWTPLIPLRYLDCIIETVPLQTFRHAEVG